MKGENIFLLVLLFLFLVSGVPVLMWADAKDVAEPAIADVKVGVMDAAARLSLELEARKDSLRRIKE